MPLATPLSRRRTLVLAGLAAALGSCAVLSPPPRGNLAVPQPARPVEIERYLGRWYELYRYEASFQKDCEAVAADYSRNPDGSIRVVNTCRKGAVDGPLKTAIGRARIVDPATSAKLKVSFFGPFYGDYWVLDHAEDYAWAIVGEPAGRYLWVLARAAEPGAAQRALLRQRVEALGYDWSRVRVTRHPAAS